MDMSPGAKRFTAVTGVALGLFWAVALWSVSARDWPFDASASVRQVSNYSGPLGSLLAWAAVELFGRVFAWLAPMWLFAVGAATMTGWLRGATRWVFKTAVLAVLLGALFALVSYTADVPALRGRVGDGVAHALSTVLGNVGSTIVLIAALLLLILGELGRLGAFVPGLAGRGGGVKARARRGEWAKSLLILPARGAAATVRVAARGVRGGAAAIARLTGSFRGGEDEYEEPEIHGPAPEAPEAAAIGEFDSAPWKRPASPTDAIQELEINSAAPQKRPGRPAPRSSTAAKRVRTGPVHTGPAGEMDADKKPLAEASLPPLSILDHDVEVKGSYSHDTLKNWSNVLEDKLLNYGVEGRVNAVRHGPVVTTFEFKPAPGVRIKDIVSRADDLALAMRARSLRMIAPIPGRAAVGIEIPNPESRIVYFQEILSEIPERQRMGGVMIALAVDVVGKPFLMNLCEAPHLLVAGTTGSGKSVCLNTILSSILFQYRPDDVQILLVDPKMIEMSTYDGIPHLLHPVITDPKEAARVLEYLTAEMMRRNELFRRHGVKNIESYNTKVSLGKIDGVDEKPERLPYIVLVVDELGDLALAKGVDIETLLARLAQMARAAGIHMVLATQRPSVDVIVGKTKANFPTRIAFRVATKVDSRTILDTIGADKLLGKGDMLYTDAHHPVPLRLHGAWVSEKNLEDLIAHWKSYQYEESNLELQTSAAGAANLDEEFDPLFDDARSIVIQFKQGSTSLLQRKLHIGYARAARLLDQLEQCRIVGPPDGSKPREVYAESVEEAME
jgi:S-DNA-T family DNA segregation ATPase FtsK/SpoIIIE